MKVSLLLRNHNRESNSTRASSTHKQKYNPLRHQNQREQQLQNCRRTSRRQVREPHSIKSSQSIISFNGSSSSSSKKSDNLPQLQKASLSLSMDLHQEEEVEFEEEEEVGRPEYRSMNMNRNQNRRRSKQITVAAAAAVETGTPPLLSSTPLPQLCLPPLLSRPTMPIMMPIPSKLFRSGTSPSPSSIKERAVVPSTLSISRPHYRWIIRELQELPSDYMLVRTNVYVPQEVVDKPSFLQQPQQVADRICQTLKSLSITIINDDDHYIDPNSTNPFIDTDEGSSGEEENILLVETQYDVKFAIRLFASSNSNSNSNKSKTMIVVEIRRTSGCTVVFREAAKTVLRSVAASANTNPQQELRTTSGGQGGVGLATTKRRTFTLPESLPKRSKEEFHQCIHDDFHIAYKMIQSTNYETQVLGLESLEQLTKAKKCDDTSNDHEQVVKNVVARFVLLGKEGEEDGDSDNENCHCLKQLLLLLDTTVTRTTDPQSTTTRQYHQSSVSSSSLLRRKIFTVLANSLEALHNSINTYSNNDQSIFLPPHTLSSFLAVLVSTVQETMTTPLQRPHDVFQAVRCVRYLFLLTSSSSKEEEEDVTVRTAMKKIYPTALDIISSYACGSNDNINDNGGYHQYHHHHPHHHHEGLQQESSMLLVQLQQQQKTLMMRSS